MPNVVGPVKYGRGERARHAVGRAAKNPRLKRVKNKANEVVGNATSRRAWELDSLGGHTGRKFGQPASIAHENQLERAAGRTQAAMVGAVFGSTGGAIAGGASLDNKNIKYAENQRKIRTNNRKIKQQEIGKARAFRVTDLGSRARRLESAEYKSHSYRNYGLGGAAVGTGLMGALTVSAHKNRKKQIKNQEKTLAMQNKKLSTVAKSGTSAFGVEHEISKAEKKSTPGRMATAAVLPGWHAGFAGKKGKKLRSVGNEYGGSVLGSIAGSRLGAVSGKTRIVAAGSVAGGMGGAIAGNHRNQRKGYLKKQPKGAL